MSSTASELTALGAHRRRLLPAQLPPRRRRRAQPAASPRRSPSPGASSRSGSRPRRRWSTTSSRPSTSSARSSTARSSGSSWSRSSRAAARHAGVRRGADRPGARDRRSACERHRLPVVQRDRVRRRAAARDYSIWPSRKLTTSDEPVRGHTEMRQIIQLVAATALSLLAVGCATTTTSTRPPQPAAYPMRTSRKRFRMRSETRSHA